MILKRNSQYPIVISIKLQGQPLIQGVINSLAYDIHTLYGKLPNLQFVKKFSLSVQVFHLAVLLIIRK